MSYQIQTLGTKGLRKAACTFTPQKTADLVTFTEEILNGKLNGNFFGSVIYEKNPYSPSLMTS